MELCTLLMVGSRHLQCRILVLVHPFATLSPSKLVCMILPSNLRSLARR